MNDSNKLRESGVEDRSYEALQRFAQAAHVKHVQPIPETWVKAVNRGDTKSEELIETRRMIDDYIRMGWNDDRIYVHVQNTNIEFLMEIGLSQENIELVRQQQNVELAGVPVQSRPAYRAALVKCVGSNIVPWETGDVKIGNNLLSLERLNMRGIPKEIFGPNICREVRVMSLAQNNLTRIGTGIANFVGLSQLKLTSNKIEYLSPEIGKLTRLKMLWLSQNSLRQVPVEIGQLTKLEGLFLNHNFLEFLPYTVGRLIHIKNLRFDNNPNLKCPPEEITKGGTNAVMAYLQALDQGDITGQVRLRNLKLKEFPIEILHPENLSCLSVHHTTLRGLDLSGNSIHDAEDAPIVLDLPQRISHRLSQLTFLSLSGNPLTRVPHFVCSLTQLETLSLEGLLFVTALPVEMGCLSNLTELHLTTSSESKRSNGAVMISPPPEILRAASKRAVLDSATRRILRIGTAGIVVQYLRMIDNAKRTRRLYLSNMGLCDFPPELQLVVGENLHPVRDKVSQQVWREKMHKTFTEPLQDLLALEYFQISNNMLTRLSPALAAFNQLRVLIADCNRIAEFPTELVWLTRLEELSAANNRLKAIPESIGKCEMLVRVNMRQNIIETVPKSVGKCVRLQTLDLAGNNIQDLPVSLGYCKNLRMINVAQNRLDSLPDVLFDLTRLETLVANGNSIVALPDNLGACRALSQLLLSCNNLQRLPLSLGHLTRLGVLCTEQNPMLLFPPVEIIALGVAKLRAFMNRFISAERSRRMLLSCMWIEQFPLSICNHHDLIFIDLSHNALKDIPNAFEAFLWLQTLQLQHNRLRILPSSICRLSRLTSLCINNNNLRDLPSTLVHLDRLTELTLHCNRVQYLPVTIGALNDIKLFSASDNPLLEPPKEIINGLRSSKMTYNYTKAIFDSATSLILTLREYRLRRIPRAVMELTNIVSIFMGGNLVSELPDTISALCCLRTLSLPGNLLEGLPAAIAKLSQLAELDLGFNRLSALGHELLALGELRRLSLEGNRLTSLPEQLNHLSRLLSLVLTSNPLLRVPQSLCLITTLTEVRLDDTMVRRLPMAFGALSNLRALILDEERMEEPRSEICARGLQVLMVYMLRFMVAYMSKSMELQCHGILELPSELFSFRSQCGRLTFGYLLTELNVSGNTLSHLPESFAEFHALTGLNLADNALHRLSGAVCWLTQLLRLDLRGNYNLRRLPLELANFRVLLECHVTIDRFLSPPREILAKFKANDTANGKLGVVEYMRLLSDARDSARLVLRRMGLRKFPPEVVSAVSAYWEYGEVRGTFVTGRRRLEALEELVLEHNNIQVLPAAIGQLIRCRILDLSANLLRVLPSSLANMTSLTTLNVSKNRLVGINPILAQMTSITKLQFHNNELREIPEVLYLLQALRELSLSKNHLTELPHSLPRITSLRNLLAAENHLQTDPSLWGLPGVSHELGFMPNLIELDVGQNVKLQVPPPDLVEGSSAHILRFLRNVFEARDTRSLKLDHMELREVPQVVQLMGRLHTLVLSDNRLRSVPACIWKLSSLTYLDLDDNQLIVLPEEATKMSNLTELRSSRNQLKRLPETCNRWIRVQRIIAQDNKIRAIPESVCEMPNLTELDLEQNSLVSLPGAFIICTSLTRLRFDTTEMVTASPAVDLPDGIRRCEIPAEIAICGVDEVIQHFFKMHEAWSTHRLDISGFGLRTLMIDVCRLSVLAELNLANNRLKLLPSEMTSLIALKKINLDNCYNLEHLNHDMYTLTNLRKISIKAGVLDSWHHPTIKLKWPPTIVARNPPFERRYLKELADCIGHRYIKDGQQRWDTTKRLDYRFVPHEVSLDPVTAAEIDSDAKRSFSDFPEEIWHHELTSLQILHIPGGRITSVQVAKHVPKLTELRKLVLIDQELDSMPGELGLLTSLEVLCFTGNHIKEIPDHIFKMISLTKLILIENQIQKLPAQIGLLTNLTDLVLTYNKLSYLPDQIGDLPKLDYLVIDENKIVQIPDTIQNLTALKEMSFNDNRITRFPVSLGALTQLEILEFAKNPRILLPPKQVLLCEVPVVIDFMQRIWCLIRSQLLVHIPLNFRNFQLQESTLEEIIKKIGPICTELDISKNLLSVLPASLKKMTALRALHISENGFTSLNLETGVETQEATKKIIKINANVTLKTFFEDVDMCDLYQIMTNEFGINKMQDLRQWVKDEVNLSLLPLGELEKVCLLDALEQSRQNINEDEEEDQFEPESSGDSEAGADGEETADGAEADEYIMDEEEAQRLLEDLRGGKMIKLDWDTFRVAARSAQIALYSAVIIAKAKIVERYRRKEQRRQDQKAQMRANGFRAKLNRQEIGGLVGGRKKKAARKAAAGSAGFQTEEELAAKKTAARARLEEERTNQKAKEEEEASKVNLNVEAGGGLVAVNLYSVGLFTALTELRAAMNKIEYLPEDLGNLLSLVTLDISNNETVPLVDRIDGDSGVARVAIGAWSRLKVLRADHNLLYDLPESICDCTDLTRLTLDYCEFQVLPAWINKIVSIEILRLAHNKIKKLPPLWGPFSQHLLELDLGYNLLSSIPQQFTWMTALKILDLSGNEIVSIPKSFGDCTALEELHVNFCALEVIDVHLAKCVKLTKFTYEGNEEMRYPPREVQMKGAEAMLKYFRQIIECPRTNIMLLDKFDLEEFDDKILDYPNVTWLNLSDNAITSIPSEVRQLQNVELVNMSNNRLGCVPRIFNLMDTITDLSVDNNGVECIEPGVVLLSNLTRLSLSCNQITRIHPSVFKLTKLEILDLNENRIGKLPALVGELRALVSLSIGSNKIEVIPNEIARLTRLRQLVLFGNRITVLPSDMDKLGSLEILTVSQNAIERFPANLAEALTHLRELWLTHNQLRVLPPEMGKLTMLEELWLQDNRLEQLPSELGELTNLRVLAMTGNNIHEIPQRVKTLKIATNADRDKGEEFWQDRELDGLSVRACLSVPHEDGV